MSGKPEAALPAVDILTVDVLCPDGTRAATVSAIDVGGGGRTVMVDGTATTVVSPTSRVWHARLLSINPFVSDDLRTCDTYDDALSVATTYAERLIERRRDIVALQADLLPAAGE